MWRNILAACWLTILSIWDIRYKKVPVWMLGTGAAAAGAALLYEIAEAAFDPISICIAMLPGAVLMTAALYTDHAGWGDGIVMLILGASLKRREPACLLRGPWIGGFVFSEPPGPAQGRQENPVTLSSVFGSGNVDLHYRQRLFRVVNAGSVCRVSGGIWFGRA